MLSFSVRQVGIKGVAACVPSAVRRNADYSLLSEEDRKKLMDTTGIEECRVAPATVTTADLCQRAAERLLSDLGWEPASVDALIFVTQTPDYLLPSTSPILQEQLGLRKGSFCLDISLGCSGYIHGLATAASLAAGGHLKRVLLLVGDTITKICSAEDKSTYPLFGDAGTVTALEFDPSAAPLSFAVAADGSGHKAIIVPDGGFRSPTSSASFTTAELEPGITRHNLHLALDGYNVFSFGINEAPAAVKHLLQDTGRSDEDIDYYIFHQANRFMNEMIRKKLKLAPEKVPYSLRHFGNTSCATIPLTMVTELRSALTKKSNLVLCGFGVGLSWGAVEVSLGDDVIISELVDYA